MKLKLLLARSFVLFFYLSLLILPSQVRAQSSSISGKITDESGNGMPGVTIMVKGTSNKVVSSADGSFRISGLSGKETLVFTNVGYQEQEIAVQNQTTINVTLTVVQKVLDEVVMIGYGTTKKSDVTGALTKISAETIRERPAQNVLQAIQGKAAGVHVSTNFKPGELPVVRIRGNRSMNAASNDPLYVIDGIPLVNALGVNSFTMSDLNPNDIASIEILKDASATAIYGSRGANGVVLITTVKGKKGRVGLSYSSTISLDSYQALTDWMDGGEYVDRWRLALINGRLYQTTTNTNLNQPATIGYPDPFLDRDKMGGLTADPTALASVWMGYEWDVYGITPKMRPTTSAEQALGWPAQVPMYNSKNIRSYDWLDAAVRQGVSQNHQVSLTSGSDISRLALSINYYNQKGVQRDQDYKRYSANISGDISATKWFTLGTSIIASLSVQNFGIQPPNTSNTGSKDLYSRATDQFPYALPKDANGVDVRNPGGNLSLWNPLIDIGQSTNERRAGAVMANVFSEIKFTPWLKYRVNFGAQYRNFRSGTWTGPLSTSHLSRTPNTAGYATEENFSWVVENLLYFDKTFAKVHKVGVTLLQSSQKSRKENTSTSVTGLINPLSLWYDLGANTAGNPGIGSGFTENTLTSFMGRVNYTLMDKYLLTASGRLDGASVLAPDHKWDFFPSFALAWKMQEESFLNSVTWINELKPRFGYGVTGSSSVNPYTTGGPLSRNPYVFGTAAAIGYLPQLVKNPLLKWEKTAQINIGLDFGLFKNRVSGSIEYYKQNTSDLIFQKILPALSGYVAKFENVGKTRNQGVEVTLSGTVLQKKDFSWNVDVNWSKNNEEIVELINGKQDMVANGLFIGQPTQVYYNYANAGIWSGDAKDLAEMALFNANGTLFRPGNVRVVDQNGDKKIDASDFIVLGTPRPKWTGGITNTFHYKNWVGSPGTELEFAL